MKVDEKNEKNENEQALKAGEKNENEQALKKEKKKIRQLAKKQRQNVGRFFSDFKKFISKGNIINLAVALVIGTAFTAIVNSLVADLLMPWITLMTGKNTLESLSWQIGEEIFIYWGKFLQTIVNFFVIAFFLFLILRVIMNTEKGITKLQKKQRKLLKKNPEIANQLPPAEPAVKIESTEDILKDIRELLAKSIK